MSNLIKQHNDEIRTVMLKALNGEMSEADSVRTIILLQRELIRTLILLSQHTETPAGLTEETTFHTSEAA